jgi:5-enolpyruvylshikimate-3-phosphate synthase
MCSALCALKATENIFIDNVQSVTTSFPNFFEILEQMGFTIEEA